MGETTDELPADSPAVLVITAGLNRWDFECDTEAEALDRLAEFKQQHPQAAFWGDFKAVFGDKTIG